MDLEPAPDPYPEGTSWDIESVEFTKPHPFISAARQLSRQVGKAFGAGAAITGVISDESHRLVEMMRTNDHTRHLHINVAWYELDITPREDHSILQVEWDNMAPADQVAAVRKAKAKGAPTAGPIIQPFLRDGRRRRR